MKINKEKKNHICIECGRKELFKESLVPYHKEKGFPEEMQGWYCPVCEY